ncbi:hypothetical protein R1flu_025018 [Riccia fluitans]|uniref:Uncharacterized protein n=1 Tax=Riccia fluitans TaxID=41844 RepID=A0ABD1XWK5_9MARC
MKTSISFKQLLEVSPSCRTRVQKLLVAIPETQKSLGKNVRDNISRRESRTKAANPEPRSGGGEESRRDEQATQRQKLLTSPSANPKTSQLGTSTSTATRLALHMEATPRVQGGFTELL